MAQVLIRNIEDDVVERLRSRAKARGTSLEETARQALRDAVRGSQDEIVAEIDRIRASSVPSEVDSTAVIRERRDHGRHRG